MTPLSKSALNYIDGFLRAFNGCFMILQDNQI